MNGTSSSSLWTGVLTVAPQSLVFEAWRKQNLKDWEDGWISTYHAWAFLLWLLILLLSNQWVSRKSPACHAVFLCRCPLMLTNWWVGVHRHGFVGHALFRFPLMLTSVWLGTAHAVRGLTTEHFRCLQFKGLKSFSPLADKIWLTRNMEAVQKDIISFSGRNISWRQERSWASTKHRVLSKEVDFFKWFSLICTEKRAWRRKRRILCYWSLCQSKNMWLLKEVFFGVFLKRVKGVWGRIVSDWQYFRLCCRYSKQD